MGNLERLLAHWRSDPSVGGNIAYWHREPPRPAAFQPLPAEIHPAIAAAFARLGYGQLYSHQAEAWELLHGRRTGDASSSGESSQSRSPTRMGKPSFLDESLQPHSQRNVAVVTGTASGKTLCYNLPVLDALLRDPQARALYIFPTKALAYDQKNELEMWIKELGSMGAGEPAKPSTPKSAVSLPPFKGEGPGLGVILGAGDGVASGPGVRVATYDGDTPTSHRSAIRKNARLLITNPDMLHYGILPNHTQWAEFLGHLRYVVIDEMHSYRGVFGSHVANVLRRLSRLLKFYGARPQFIMASATIANPQELAEKLIEQPVVLIDRDGSPRGERNFAIYNPPIVDRELGLRASLAQESVRLVSDLLRADVQTILFGRTRRMVEVMLHQLTVDSRQLTEDARARRTSTNTRRGGVTPPAVDESESPHSTSSPSPFKGTGDGVASGPGVREVRGYRGGYLTSERRAIEAGLRSGELRAVVATNALELGVDIGGMGAAVLAGYPGSIAATWQQAGRAGRGADASVALLVASSNPLDQFLARHPDYLMGRTPEHALINPDNLLILLSHLRCAAFELPFTRGENFGNIPGERVGEFLDLLAEGNELHISGDKYFWMADGQPSRAVSLRGMGSDTVVIQAQIESPAEASTPKSADSLPPFKGEGAGLGVISGAGDGVGTWQLVGEVDPFGAMWLVHPDAIYIHDGATYFVEKLDLDEHVAYLRPIEADYYTVPKSRSTVSLVEEKEGAPVSGGVKHFGEVNITQQITGYEKIQWSGMERPGGGELDLPPMELNTFGYWLSIAEATVESLRERGLWTNDPNEYGPNWAAIRDRVRARDHYTCQVCGAPENGISSGTLRNSAEPSSNSNATGVFPVARPHDVHHKVPFRTFASPKEANRMENLVTLCRNCHRRAETIVRIRSGLAGLSFVLQHLAPLYLMCDPRDLGVFSDPKADLAEGAPVVMVFDQMGDAMGFSRRLFEIHDELMRAAYELVRECGCQDGCPSCVGPGGEQGQGSKKETLALLEELIGNPEPELAGNL